MPVYTYRCDNCGVQFDQKEGFNDPTMVICPECEEESLHRVYRPVGIVFKGSGFYATDNRSPSGQKARSQDKESQDKEEGTAKSEKTENKTSEKKSAEPAKKESKKEE
ncbi:MAG: zinc ribbon domain-containing protein [Anaerolineae bacterium]|nr:zinc ribbon domain-containing protein [Anaerolineae bacterium]